MTAQDTSDVNARKFDTVDHPRHYNVHPSGMECIDIAELLSFNLGNCLKYCWRAGEKGAEKEDLEKALWYLERERRRASGVVAWLRRLLQSSQRAELQAHIRPKLLPMVQTDFPAFAACCLADGVIFAHQELGARIRQRLAELEGPK